MFLADGVTLRSRSTLQNLFSVEQAFVGRGEIRAPLKTPAWEATLLHTKLQTRERDKQGRKPEKKIVPIPYCNVTSWFAIALAEIRTGRILREKADSKQSRNIESKTLHPRLIALGAVRT